VIGIAIFLVALVLISLPYGAIFGGIASLLSSPLVDKALDSILGRERSSICTVPLDVWLANVPIPSRKYHESQIVNMTRASMGGPSNNLSCLFGVIRVEAHTGDVTRCRAELRYGTDIWSHNAQTGENIKVFTWLNGGNLEWYSQSLRMNCLTHPQFDIQKLGLCLTNMYEDLYEDHPRYLLLCFLPIDQRVVYLCSDIGWPIGMFDDNQPLRFKAEITFTGEGLRKTVHLFDVEVSKNQISVKNT
jgi:hypothetical protein